MSCGDLEWMIHIILNCPFYRWQLKVTEKLGQCQTVSNWKPFLINVQCWLVLVDEIRTTVEWILLHGMNWLSSLPFQCYFNPTPPLTLLRKQPSISDEAGLRGNRGKMSKLLRKLKPGGYLCHIYFRKSFVKILPYSSSGVILWVWVKNRGKIFPM